jgi:hypothetical protein
MQHFGKRGFDQSTIRGIAQGSAAPLFDEMVGMTEQWLADADKSRPDPPDLDRRSRATIRTAMALAISVLHLHVSRSMASTCSVRREITCSPGR